MGKTVAKITIKAEKIEEFMKLVHALARPTRAEEACLFYELYQMNDDPTVFYFVEEWETEEDLQKHLQKEHVCTFASKVGALTATDVQPFQWTRIV